MADSGTYTGSKVTNTASGSTVGWRAKMVYAIADYTDYVSVSFKCYMSVDSGDAPWFNKNRISGYLTIAGSNVKTYSGPSSDKTTFKNDVQLITYSTTYKKTTVAQTKSCSFKITVSSYSSWKGTSTATLAATGQVSGIEIPALTSKEISYDGNGEDSGSIDPVKKYYTIDIPLASSGFVKQNYSLVGWNTAADGSGETYALGATYSENPADDVVMHAQWHLDYILPEFLSFSAMRVDDQGSAKDTGELIKVSFTYRGGTINGGETYRTPSCRIYIDSDTSPVDEPVLSGGSFTDIYDNSSDGYSTETQHYVVVELYDSDPTYPGVASVNTVIGTATYPIDLLADGNNVYMGIMSPAVPRQEITMGKIIGIVPDMSVQEVSNFIASLDINGGRAAVDYVVEEGSLTVRDYYRKWASGKAEFWYRINDSGVTTAVWSSPIYYFDSSSWANIWSGVFNGTPTQVICSSNHSQFISIIPIGWSKDGITNLRFISVGAKTNQAYGFSVYAIGTWRSS